MAKRLQYIDAMRGLAMLMVVSFHLTQSGLHLDGNPFIACINDMLQNPLFFFISGFLSDISFKDYSFGKLIGRLCRKVPAFIVAPILFGALYCLIFGCPFIELIFGVFRAGYWFTIMLFEFLILYYVFWRVIKMLKVSFSVESILLFVSAIPVLAIWIYLRSYDVKSDFINFFGLYHTRNYVYFILGVLCHRYSIRMDRLVGKTKQMLAILFGLIVIIMLIRGANVIWDSAIQIQYIIVVSCGVMLIFTAFQKYECAITNSVPGRWLILIGRRTLDVYFFHYFFLPYNMHVAGQWLQANLSPLYAYVLVIVLSAIPIIAALLVGSLLRMFPLTAALLGAKASKPTAVAELDSNT